MRTRLERWDFVIASRHCATVDALRPEHVVRAWLLREQVSADVVCGTAVRR